MNRTIEGDNGETLRIEDGKFTLVTNGEKRELTSGEALIWFRKHDMPPEFMLPAMENKTVAEIEEDRADFFERHPKCQAFSEIFHYLRSLEIGADVAADVAKSLLWAESRTSKGRGIVDSRFRPKITAEEFLSLFSEKAGASYAGLKQEAINQFLISERTFAMHLKKHSDAGDIIKTESGLWRLAAR